jgi:asparagine synthase (glutamine-hydrolysing)
MEFCRLAINDLSDEGMQPFVSATGALVCNGEIYNHSDFSDAANDCACLIPMIESLGIMETSRRLRGVFAMCYTDGQKVLASRDPLGVRPLFFTRLGGGHIAFSSEVKGLVPFGTRVEIFPPGHIYDSSVDQFACWYPCYWDLSPTPLQPLRETFEDAVRIRVQNTDRSLGFLLSGGLDSSLVVAVAQKFLPGQRLKTFSIGTSDESPDIKAARIVAKHLNTDHTEIIFTVKEGIDVLEDVIFSLESYDTTTVRASVPMWILARWISKNTDCKVILSGEGSDELFGGYLYFHGAPNVNDFSKECGRRLKLIHQFDGLRADRCMAAHGLELRVPFLDRDVVEFGMTMDQSLKVSQPEKKFLREAFVGLLPDEILWRQKNGMSDAVGYNWVDTIKEYTKSLLNSEEFLHVCYNSGTHNKPQSFEEAVYRAIFWDRFGQQDHLISEIWRPRWTTVTDPSARQLSVFSDDTC